MIYVVNINNKEYEVEVEKGKANIVRTTDIQAPSQVVAATPAPIAATPVQTATTSQTAAAVDGNPIAAPMPGTILDIRVNIGDKVKSGQLLVILEAMKMENEIYAPADGTIVQILVSKGSMVDTNQMMMIVK